MSDADLAHPNILEVLDDLEFPATLIEIIGCAEDADASEEVLDQLRAMPDRDYHSIEEINRNLNRIEALPGEENTFSSEETQDLPIELHDKPVILQR